MPNRITYPFLKKQEPPVFSGHKEAQRPITPVAAPAGAPARPDWTKQQPHERFADVPSRFYLREEAFRPRYWQDQALTYWENPQRVARYYQVQKAQPPGAPPKPWLDHELLGAAYDALRQYNKNEMWWNWQPLPYTDPLSQQLRNMAPPPLPLLTSMGEEKYYQPTPTEELPSPAQAGMTDEDWSKLPRWQRFLVSSLQSPIFAGAMGGVAGVPIGFALGGPVGAAVGGIAGVTAGVYAQQHPESTMASALMYLDLPAEWVEQGMGTIYQVGKAISEPEKYGEIPWGDWDELMKWLGAARQAATLAYTAGGQGFEMPGSEFAGIAMQQFMRGGGLIPQLPVNLDILNLMAQADIALDPMLDIIPGWETPPGLERLSMPGEVWKFGEPFPVKIDGDLAGVMYDARTRILQGEQPEKVIQEYMEKYGATGQLRELVGHIVIDPINIIPVAVSKGGAFTAAKLGKVELATAFATTHGLTEAAQKYGTILRATRPISELSEAGAVTRWLTGVTKAGELKILASATEGGGLFRYLLRMKPASRAAEVVNTSAVNLSVILAATDGTPDELVRIIKMLADTPDDVARELSMRSILAPDGAAIPMFLKDFGDVADESLLKWQSTVWQRKLLQNIAEVTGKSDAEVMQLIANATDAEVLLRQFVDAAREKGGGAADSLIKGYDDARAAVSKLPPEEHVTGEKLSELVKVFIDDELPHNQDMFRGQLYAAAMDQAADWSAKWFGVEPDPAWIRTSQMVKSAQSLLLLGLNPTYFVNNTLNNLLTTAATGVFGIRSVKTMDKIWTRAGIMPPRLRAGVGPAALGTEISHAAIREAMSAPGMLTTVTRFFNEKTRKIQIFSNLSMKAEQFSSGQAFTTGFVQFMGRHWKEGVGFHRMPAPLERALGQLHPDLPKMVYGAIKGGMNQAEIESALWGGFTRRSLDGAIPNLAESLKAQGARLSEADIRELLSHSGIDDLLRDKLKDAKTDADVRAAFDDVNGVVQDQLDRLVAQDFERTAAEVAGRISGGEGLPAVLELFDQQQLDFAERWFENFAEWEKAFTATENMTYGERNVVMQATAARQRKKWNRYYSSERAKFQGMIEGLGIDGADNRRVLSLVDQAQQNHKTFFEMRDKKNREFFNTKYDSPTERNLAWDVLQEELLEAYNNMTSKELHIQDQLDGMTLNYLEGKFGPEAREAGTQWRTGVGEIRQNMIDEMRAMRDALRTMPVDERRTAWLTFLHGRDGYLEQIGELFRRNVDGAHELYNRLRGRGGAEPEPPPVPGIPPPVGAPEPGAAPAPPAEGVAVPLMLTHAMKARLRELGYSADDIAQMKPDEALAVINKGEAPKVPGVPPTLEAPAPEVEAVVSLSPVGRRVQVLENGIIKHGVVDAQPKLHTTDQGARMLVRVRLDDTRYSEWYDLDAVTGVDVPRETIIIPEAQPPSTRAVFTENARIAAENGIPLIDAEGNRISGAEIHLMNAVRKYGGEEAQAFNRLDEVPSDLLQRALDERARVRAETEKKWGAELKAELDEIAGEEVVTEVHPIDQAIVEGRLTDLPEDVRANVEEAYGEMTLEVDAAEQGMKIFTEAEKGGALDVIGVKSTYPDWWGDLKNPFYRDARGNKYTGKFAVQQVLRDLAEGKINPKNKVGDDYVLVQRARAQALEYLQTKKAYQIATGQVDISKQFKEIVWLNRNLKDIWIWDNPEKLRNVLNELNDIIAEISDYDYEKIQLQMDYALDMQDTMIARLDELSRIPPEELTQLVRDAERLARVELSAFESRTQVHDYQMEQGVPPSELFQKPKQPGFWEAGEETPLFTGAAQKAREGVFQPTETPTQGMMPGFESQMKGAKPGGEASGPLFDAAARAGLFRRELRQKFIDHILSKQKEVLSGAWDAQTQADAFLALADARANVWAKDTGRKAWEWYEATFADVTSRPVDATNDPYLLGQIEANKRTPGYQAFAEGNKTVDANGDLIVVYHSAVEMEGFAEQALYFSDSIDSVNANYAGVGPDPTITLSKRISQEMLDFDGLNNYKDEISQYFGLTADDFDRLLNADPERLMDMVSGDVDGLTMTIARKQITGENKGMVIPSYLRMENPARLDPNDVFFESPQDFINQIKALRDDGYDGVMMDDGITLPGMEGTSGARHYIVWEPEQVKSVFNVGQFDPTNPDIYYQRSFAASPASAGDEGAGVSVVFRRATEWVEGRFDETVVPILESEGGAFAIAEDPVGGYVLDSVFGEQRHFDTLHEARRAAWEEAFTLSREEPGNLMYQAEVRPGAQGYSSALRKLIAEEMPGRMAVDQLRKLIDDGVINPRELEWSGIHGWLDEQVDFVTKDAILRFLDEDKGGLEGLPLYNQKKGAVQFLKDGRAVIYALESPDISTMVHELGHVFRMDLRRTIAQAVDDPTSARLMADFETSSKWAGVIQDADGEFLWSGEAANRYGIDSDQYRVALQAEEKFARGFEEYLMMGKAPSPELVPVFEKFKEWLAHVYARLHGELAGVTPEMKDVYNRLLVEYPEAADYSITTEMGRAKVPAQGQMFQPSPPQNTENFVRWFRNSKVVEPDGSPMAVYHGTKAAFEAFDPDRSRDFGFHFGTQEQAGTIAGMEAPAGPYYGANVHEVFLSIENPLRVDDFQWGGKGLETLVDEHLPPLARLRLNGLMQRDNELFTAMLAVDSIRNGLDVKPQARLLVESFAKEFGSTLDGVTGRDIFEYQRFKAWLSGQRFGEPVPGQPGPVTEKGVKRLINEAIIGEFEDLGYDGMVYANRIEGAGDSWITFHPEQVKSVRNTGEFSPVDPRMLHQGIPLEYENGYTTRLLYQDDIPDANMPLGEVQSHIPSPPSGEMQDEAFRNNINPILHGLEDLMTGPGAQLPEQVANLDANLDPATMRQLRAYMGQTYGDLAETKLAGVRWAENRRDAALLNYNRRYGFDNYLTAIFPYQFWYTRTAIQWALRFIDKPAWLAQYARIRNFQRNTIQTPGFPFRLKDKMKMPVPYLPEWAGGGIYVDPFRQIFPFEQFARPWEQRAQDQNMIVKRAVSTLEWWGEEGEEDSQAVKDALDFRAGPLWEKAITMAELDVESQTSNPWDFINLIMGPSLPVGWGYEWARGSQDRISQLPASRLIQNVSGALGANQGRGWNIEGPIRRALRLPEQDRYHDYRVDREISNLVAEGSITPEDANLAMVDQAGDAFLMAQQRAAKSQQMKYLGAPLGADLFPEGEQTQRALKLEYDKAREAKDAGQEDAITLFFDAHPEYEARMQLFKEDPEERLRFFLRSSIWESYYELPDLHQKQLREQLGDVFTQAFLNKDTRSYDSIDTPTLAQWARVMKGVVPEAAPETPEAQVQLATEEETAAYQAFADERDRKFPNIGRILEVMYEAPEGVRDEYQRRFPEVDDYYQWRNEQFAKHPEILPYALSDESKMAGAPQEVQVLYYQYQMQRDQKFPDIFDTQNAYYQIPPDDKKAKKAYRAEHPELVEYWEWRRDFMRQFPNMIPYLMSEESLAEAVLGEEGSYGSGRSTNQSIDINQLDPTLMRKLSAYYMFNEPLGPGAQKALKAFWESQGKPGDTFKEFLDEILKGEF